MTNTNLLALKTLTVKECRRILRIWSQTLIPPMITMSLYFLIFGKFMGARVGLIDNVTYISYITPGFILMAALINTYSNVSSSVFSQKFQRSIEELLVAPITNSVLLWGFLFGGLFRGVLIAIVVTLVSCLFTPLSFTHYFFLLFAIIFSLLPLALAGFINGILAKKFDDVSIIPNFILTPLTYLGGVFYPITQLTSYWHTLSLFNPVVYMVGLFRYGMLGVVDINRTLAVCVLLLLTGILYVIAWWLLANGTGLRNR